MNPSTLFRAPNELQNAQTIRPLSFINAGLLGLSPRLNGLSNNSTRTGKRYADRRSSHYPGGTIRKCIERQTNSAAMNIGRGPKRSYRRTPPNSRWTGAAGACFASSVARRRWDEIAPPGQLHRSAAHLKVRIGEIA